jgi:hypothetical protein
MLLKKRKYGRGKLKNVLVTGYKITSEVTAPYYEVIFY